MAALALRAEMPDWLHLLQVREGVGGVLALGEGVESVWWVCWLQVVEGVFLGSR